MSDSKKSNEKIQQIKDELASLGYEYIDGFISNKKDKVRAIHLKCGNERKAKFSLYDKQECRYCKRASQSGGKFNNIITDKDKQKIINLYKEKGNVRIVSDKVGFSTTAVRMLLNENGIDTSKKKKEKIATCIICGNKFEYKYTNRDKLCSGECKSKHTAKIKTKYNQSDIQEVVDLKKLKQTHEDIQEQTGVGSNKIKEIVRENNLYLTNKEIGQNAYKAKIAKNPNAMEHMRSFYKGKYTIKDLKKFAKEKKGKCLSNEYLGCHGKHVWQCEYGHEWEATWASKYIADQWCPACANLRSKGELELLEWVQSHGLEAYSTRQIIPPKEIDIYIPSLKIGIEYCGLYWHSEEQGKDQSYHYHKMKMSNEKGVRLITIFEDEWNDRKDQVKNFLKSTMGISEKRIYARKTVCKEIDKETARDFLEASHIQGSAPIKVAYGLYFENDLVAVMTGNKHHRQGFSDIFVLNRLAFKDGVQVVGGASKLLKSLVKYCKDNNYKELISWSDNRYSEGNVYKKLGFEFVEELKPDYSYYDMVTNTRQSKQSNKKSLLLKKGAEGDMSNTEKELALSLFLYRIWDCGKIRWKISL